MKTVAVTPDPQVKVELKMPHDPLEVFSVNPDPRRVSLIDFCPYT